MKQAEREQLRRDLAAAGCQILADQAPYTPDCILRELRQLLRRDEPQPITEAALREAGFEEPPDHADWLQLAIGNLVLAVMFDFVDGDWIVSPATFQVWDSQNTERWIDFEHIHNMQALRTVIAALGGEVRE